MTKASFSDSIAELLIGAACDADYNGKLSSTTHGGSHPRVAGVISRDGKTVHFDAARLRAAYPNTDN